MSEQQQELTHNNKMHQQSVMQMKRRLVTSKHFGGLVSDKTYKCTINLELCSLWVSPVFKDDSILTVESVSTCNERALAGNS